MTETSAPIQSLAAVMQVVLARLVRGEDVNSVLEETGIQARLNESIAAIKEPAFVSVQTVHSALVSWCWKQECLHDSDYKDEVRKAVNKASQQAEALYEVAVNQGLRCQWEGVEFCGDNIADLTGAADYVARKLKRFKGVEALGV